VKKEMLLDPGELQQFQNHSSQMAALDFMVSVASNTFVPTYYGNMARVVEGHRRIAGFASEWNNIMDEFSSAVKLVHEKRMGQPTRRIVVVDKPKEEDYFYSNPQGCLCEGTSCDDLLGPVPGNSTTT
ncbi:unnamed protein product, partial [Thlaspi arvense]